MFSEKDQKIKEVEAYLDGKPLMTLAGYIILVKKPNDDTLYGIVEQSFSLDTSKTHTFFFWDSPKGGRFREMDGKVWVQKDCEYWNKNHPDWEFTIYDARDDSKLPVTIDWESWLDAHEPSDKTLSGIKDKYRARNLRFTKKEEVRSNG
jgi:hypothetical protein